ncbi:hypothetical protein [Empedobacter brevis]|uniref:hypothetical protein n=1 Tax=Empedobacter brevis TaxID=247 RepID=UPI00289A2026|nr:hypothetical protein [Empedobacter brevis]
MLDRVYLTASLFVVLSSLLLAQKVTTSKFGEIVYTMSQKQVAALTPDKLAVYEVTNKYMPEQDIIVHGIKYHISYYKNMKTNQFEVYTVSSSDQKLSTLSGIKVGSTLEDLWKNYKKYDISIQEGREDEETKSTRVFMINDIDNGCTLSFYLKNNVVVKMMLSNESGYLNNNVYED